MAEAVLQFTVRGGEELRAILGRSAQESVRASRSAAAGTAAAEREATRAKLKEIAARQRAEIASQAATAKAQALATKLVQAESAKRAKAEGKAQADATKSAEREAAKRAKAAEKETKAAERVATAKVASLLAAEARVTAGTERELARRTKAHERAERAARPRGPRGGSGGGGGGGSGGVGEGLRILGGQTMQFASSMHSQIQDARGRRASVERTLNQALYQAGASGANAGSLRNRVTQFAQAEGMDSGELSQALNRAQTEFSVLGNSRSSQTDREASLRTFLDNARFARDTGQDVSEVTRVSGLLSQSGLSAPQQRDTLLGLTGMAQRGAIELGSVTATAMAPIVARMGQAEAEARRRNPAATPGEIAQARRSAVTQTFAEMEVGRSLGFSPREMGNVTSRLGGALQSDAVQQRMLNNLNHAGAQGSSARDILFERGEGGQMRLRSQYQSALGLAGGLRQAFNGDAAAMQNVFAGSGHGNAQGLLVNQRRILGGMMQGDAQIQGLISGVGKDFTEADVSRGRDLFKNDEQSRLTSVSETHDNALTSNTDAIVQLSKDFADWSGKNPYEKEAAGSILSDLGGIGGGGGGGGQGGGGGGAGGGLGGGGGGPSGGLVSLAVKTAARVGVGAGNWINSKIEGASGARGTTDLSSLNLNVLSEAIHDIRGPGTATAQSGLGAAMGRRIDTTAIAQAVRDGLQNATITVNPTVAAQTVAAGATGVNPRGGANAG